MARYGSSQGTNPSHQYTITYHHAPLKGAKRVLNSKHSHHSTSLRARFICFALALKRHLYRHPPTSSAQKPLPFHHNHHPIHVTRFSKKCVYTHVAKLPIPTITTTFTNPLPIAPNSRLIHNPNPNGSSSSSSFCNSTSRP